MRKTSKYGSLILAIICGLFLYLCWGEDFNFAYFGIIITLFFFGLITCVVILVSDIIQFKAKKKFYSFLPSLISAILVCGTFYALNRQNKPSDVPIFFQAGYDPGVGGCSLVLREDSSYEFLNGGPLSSHTEHGTFRLIDSFIFLNRGNADKALVSNRLLITNSIPNNKFVIQVDASGKEIANSIPFIIHLDRRNQ